MTLPNWNDDLSVGVDTLDADHQRLIDTMNDVFDGLLLGTGSSSTHKALLALGEYVNDHFRREEEWMVERGYPHLAQHRKEHQALREQVAHLTNVLEHSEKEVTLELLIVLRDWLYGHIGHSDVNAAAEKTQAASANGDRGEELSPGK